MDTRMWTLTSSLIHFRQRDGESEDRHPHEGLESVRKKLGTTGERVEEEKAAKTQSKSSNRFKNFEERKYSQNAYDKIIWVILRSPEGREAADAVPV